MNSLRFFKCSKSVFAVLISLGLLLSACNLPTSGGANPLGDTPTPALLSTLMASGVTLTAATTFTPAHTATPAPAFALTASTRAAAGTAASPAPTPLESGSSSPAELAQFPPTLRTSDVNVPAAAPCDHLMTQQPSGAAGEPTTSRPVMRGLSLCIWGLSLDDPVQLTFTSPDGAQRLSGTFRLVQQPDNTYKVAWPGAEKFNTGSATALEGGMNYINLNLWWPGGLAAGEWRIEASGGGQAASGRLVIPAPTQAWTSLESDGSHLQALDGCHILLPGVPERPLSAVGAGYAPGTTLLALYRRSLDKPADPLVRQAVMSVPVGTGGTFRVSFWLSRLSKDGPNGEFWLVPLTSTSRAFAQTGDRASVQNVVDCFVIP